MHLARVYIAAGLLEEARRQLDQISSPEQEAMKQQLLQQLEIKAR